MNAATEIALVPPQETAMQVYTTPNGLDPFIAHIRAQIDEFNTNLPDLSTLKNRQLYASMAHKVAKSKNALDAVGKELSAEAKKQPKLIDAERKRCWDLLEAWQVEVRKPLDDWQAAEDARIDRHQAVIDELNERGAEAGTYDADYLRGSIATVESVVIGENLEEFEAEAARAKDKALTALRAALAVREKADAEQAELIELRRKQAEQEQKDREARIAQEAAANAQREAEQRAQAERDAAAQRERDLELQAERAKRENLEAQQRAEQAERNAKAQADQAAQAERQRQADEQAEVERQTKAREADIKHKKAVNNAALAAFIAGGMPEDCAKQAVTLIAKRQIPNISITY